MILRIESVVGKKDIPLAALTREHARAYRDLRLKSVKAATVKREFNTIVAILNHAITEFDLQLANSFAKMKYPKGVVPTEAQEDKGKPFPDDILNAITERITTKSKNDARLIWQLLEGTGCRLNEIAGLRVEDVVIEHDYPHLSIQENRLRRLKNASSIRLVPLVGDTLKFAKEAAKIASTRSKYVNGDYLFPRYVGKTGSNSISKILMKHVRAITSDPALRTHSLRANMKGNLAEAGIEKSIRDMMQGHAVNDVGDRHYLGMGSRLKVFTDAMAQTQAYVAARRRKTITEGKIEN